MNPPPGSRWRRLTRIQKVDQDVYTVTFECGHVARRLILPQSRYACCYECGRDATPENAGKPASAVGAPGNTRLQGATGGALR